MKKRKIPEALIFDIDGTLLNVEESFYSAIIEASNIWWKLFEHKNPPFKPDFKLIKRFKEFPGFNDDWEVAISVILLQKLSLTREISPTEVLKSIKPQGLKDLERKLGNLLKEDQKKKIRRICMEIYGGEECEKIYGFKPLIWVGKGGLWKKERPLFNVAELRKRFKIGIYTGRNKGETLLALKLLGLKLNKEYIITADEFKKPDPRALFKLVQNLKSKDSIFIGDSEDDRLTVLNYKRLFGYPIVEFVNVKLLIEKVPYLKPIKTPLLRLLLEARLPSARDDQERQYEEPQ